MKLKKEFIHGVHSGCSKGNFSTHGRGTYCSLPCYQFLFHPEGYAIANGTRILCCNNFIDYSTLIESRVGQCFCFPVNSYPYLKAKKKIKSNITYYQNKTKRPISQGLQKHCLSVCFFLHFNLMCLPCLSWKHHQPVTAS